MLGAPYNSQHILQDCIDDGDAAHAGGDGDVQHDEDDGPDENPTL